MNLEDLRKKAEEAKALANKATPGPWVSMPLAHTQLILSKENAKDIVGQIAAENRFKNLDFILASRTLVPELADAVLELIERDESWKLGHYQHACLILSCDHKLAIATEALKFYRDQLSPFAKGSDQWPMGIHEIALEAIQKIEEKE